MNAKFLQTNKVDGTFLVTEKGRLKFLYSKSFSSFSRRKLAATFGLEIFNSSLEAMSPVEYDGLRQLLLQHKFLVIRDQELTNEQLYSVAHRFGQPVRYTFSNGVEGFPEIIEIKRSPEQVTALSTMWHSDSTYLDSPPDFTLLYGVEIPPYGGNTAFSDTVSAFLDLSRPFQSFLQDQFSVARSDLHANNERLSHLSNPSEEKALQAVHPAVKINSDTGLSSIYVNEEHSSHFRGMTFNESRPIIDYLIKHIAKDKYRVDVNWLPGTVLISDNRSTQHRAIDNYYGHSRTLRRVIVKSV